MATARARKIGVLSAVLMGAAVGVLVAGIRRDTLRTAIEIVPAAGRDLTSAGDAFSVAWHVLTIPLICWGVFTLIRRCPSGELNPVALGVSSACVLLGMFGLGVALWLNVEFAERRFSGNLIPAATAALFQRSTWASAVTETCLLAVPASVAFLLRVVVGSPPAAARSRRLVAALILSGLLVAVSSALVSAILLDSAPNRSTTDNLVQWYLFLGALRFQATLAAVYWLATLVVSMWWHPEK